MSIFECLTTVSSSTVYISSALLLFLHICFWGAPIVAITAGIFLFLMFFGLWLLRDWALHDFYLSEKAEKVVRKTFIGGLAVSALGFVVASLFFPNDSWGQLYAASVFFLIFIGKEWIAVAVRVQAIATTDPDVRYMS